MNCTPCNNISVDNSSTRPTYDTAEYRRNTIILIVVSIIIVTINGLVILAFMLENKLRQRPANVLICSQAFTDLLTGVFYIPTYIIETYHKTTTVMPFIICYMLFLSLFNLLALSMDRYLALYKPFLHHRITDLRKTIKLLFIIWIVPLGLTLIPLAWWSVKFPEKPQQIYLFFMWLFMLLLVVAMTALYLCVTAKAKRTIRYKRQSIPHTSGAKLATLARKELRVAHLFGLLLFFFVSAYLPVLYMNLCDLIGHTDYIPHVLETVGLYSLVFNSVVNPILCIYLKKDYLQVIKNVLHINRSYFRQLRKAQRKNMTQVEYCKYDEESVHNFQQEWQEVAVIANEALEDERLDTAVITNGALKENLLNGYTTHCSSNDLEQIMETPSL